MGRGKGIEHIWPGVLSLLGDLPAILVDELDRGVTNKKPDSGHKPMEVLQSSSSIIKLISASLHLY